MRQEQNCDQRQIHISILEGRARHGPSVNSVFDEKPSGVKVWDFYILRRCGSTLEAGEKIEPREHEGVGR